MKIPDMVAVKSEIEIYFVQKKNCPVAKAVA